ncbi:hypothetical protein SOVF_210730 [Spinacia oleracea]|nr:hypothetical protein SOVF_210730 [Spinacia oleracea]
MEESSAQTTSSTQKTSDEEYAIEFTLEKGKDLEPPYGSRRLRLGKPMRTYAMVWADPAKKQRTRIDKLGGSDPNWNCKFKITYDEIGNFMSSIKKLKFNVINIEIYSSAIGLMPKDRLIGATSIKIKDIPFNEIGYFPDQQLVKGRAKPGCISGLVKKRQDKAGLLRAGWISVRTNVAPYTKPPPQANNDDAGWLPFEATLFSTDFNG